MKTFRSSMPADAFRYITEYLVKAKKEYNLVAEIEAQEDPYPERHSRCLDAAFGDKTAGHCGQTLRWADWLVEGVFPTHLYEEAGRSLRALIRDERFYDDPPLSFQSKESYHNFIGRMSRPRPVFVGSPYTGFLDYTLERFADESCNRVKRSMPHFYFSVEDPAWIFEPLVRNPALPRTNRTSVSCVCNVSFRYSPERKTTIITLILKHCQWSHLWGDIWGGTLFANAFHRELGLENTPVVVIDAMAITLDKPKQAKDYLRRLSTPERIRA